MLGFVDEVLDHRVVSLDPKELGDRLNWHEVIVLFPDEQGALSADDMLLPEDLAKVIFRDPFERLIGMS